MGNTAASACRRRSACSTHISDWTSDCRSRSRHRCRDTGCCLFSIDRILRTWSRLYDDLLLHRDQCVARNSHSAKVDWLGMGVDHTQFRDRTLDNSDYGLPKHSRLGMTASVWILGKSMAIAARSICGILEPFRFHGRCIDGHFLCTCHCRLWL